LGPGPGLCGDSSAYVSVWEWRSPEEGTGVPARPGTRLTWLAPKTR
jgi:hypothetical protein